MHGKKILTPRVPIRQINMKKAIPMRRIKTPRNNYTYKTPLEYTSPADEFQDPEYLRYQKVTINTEIKKLKSEIQELSNKFTRQQNLFKSMDHDLSGNDNSEKWLSSRLAELHGELDVLVNELATSRRLYSETTEVRLKQDIMYQRTMLADLNCTYNQITNSLESDKKKLEDINGSDITLLIQHQKKEIASLKKDLSVLNNDEQGMLEEYMAIVNDVNKMERSEKFYEEKKRSLKQAEYAKMKANSEYRKLKKEYSDKVNLLEQLIKDKQDKAKVKESIKRRIYTTRFIPRTPETVESNKEESEQETVHTPLRVTFDPESTRGRGIPLKQQILMSGELGYDDDSNEILDEDEILDLEGFTPQFRVREPPNPNDTFFADSVQGTIATVVTN